MTFPKITTTHLVLAAFLAGLLTVPILTTLILDLYDFYYVADQVVSGYVLPPVAEPVPFPDYGYVSGAGGSLASDSASFGVGTSGASSAGSGGVLQNPTTGG